MSEEMERKEIDSVNDMPICIICQSSYDKKKDTFDWVSGGLPCCTYSVHLSCLARWRFNNVNANGELVTSCPVCVSTYLPAVWFFEQVAFVLRNYLHVEAEMEDRSDPENLQEYRKNAPLFLAAMRRRKPSVTIEHFMAGVMKNIESVITYYEMIEKSEPGGGLGKFIKNYATARKGKYSDIPPIDEHGNRITESNTGQYQPQQLDYQERQREQIQQQLTRLRQLGQREQQLLQDTLERQEQQLLLAQLLIPPPPSQQQPPLPRLLFDEDAQQQPPLPRLLFDDECEEDLINFHQLNEEQLGASSSSLSYTIYSGHYAREYAIDDDEVNSSSEDDDDDSGVESDDENY